MRRLTYLCCLLSVAGMMLAEGPVMGWSSWNTYRVNINDSLIYSKLKLL